MLFPFFLSSCATTQPNDSNDSLKNIKNNNDVYVETGI